MLVGDGLYNTKHVTTVNYFAMNPGDWLSSNQLQLNCSLEWVLLESRFHRLKGSIYSLKLTYVEKNSFRA